MNTFYNLVTDFYEWGWGTSFHFSPQLPGKTQCAPRLHELALPGHAQSCIPVTARILRQLSMQQCLRAAPCQICKRRTSFCTCARIQCYSST